MTAEEESKLLSELRVTELKAELDKRGLDKNGIKIILSDRLEKALKAEGHDPATYKFFVSESSVSSTPQKTKDEPMAQEIEENITIPDVDVSGDGVGEEATEKSSLEGEESSAQNITKDEEGEDDNLQNEEEQLEDPLNEQPSEKTNEAPRNGHTHVSDPDCMFWVRGLNPSTKAADLRELFSQHGKIIRAKIFTSKKIPGKTFGLVTVAEPDMVDKCYIAHDNKAWNGTVITIDKGNANNMSSKAAAAASASVSKKETTKASTEEPKSDTKKDEKEHKEEGKHNERKNTGDGKERDKEREKRDADRTKDAKPRREPVREPRRDIRKTIADARRPPMASGHRSFRRPSISSRLSRGTHVRPTPPSRRVESYGRSDADRERQRAREDELRRRAAEMELEKEKERLRAERERIEREKLELQLLKQQAQLAAYERAAGQGSSSRHRTESTRHGSSGARRDDRYSSRSSGESHRPHERPMATRDRDRDHRTSRTDDRRLPAVPSRDRSRSRHNSSRESHAVPRDSRYVEIRRDARNEIPTARPPGSSYGGRGYHRDAVAAGMPSGQNYYGTRESYSSGVNTSGREYDHGGRAPPSSSGAWGSSGGSWSGMPAENKWGANANEGSGNWSNYGTGSAPSNARIDFDKYRRQRQF